MHLKWNTLLQHLQLHSKSLSFIYLYHLYYLYTSSKHIKHDKHDIVSSLINYSVKMKK